jgi:TctA family transporter
MRSQYYVTALLAFVLVLGTLASPPAARALPISDAQLFVLTSGEVIVTFLVLCLINTLAA